MNNKQQPMNMSYSIEDFNKIQKENDELLETLKRATAMVIELNQEARELHEENQQLVGLIIKLKAELDRLKGSTNDQFKKLSKLH